MTLLQAVFSLHAILCYFYGGVTFFHTQIAVELQLANADWLRKKNSVLLKQHGACVLGLGLVALSAAQFEEANSRNSVAKCMLGFQILLCYALGQEWTESGQYQPPVAIGSFVFMVLYIICAFVPDKDVPVPPPSPGVHKDKTS
eukprot:CAMPEP_0177693768 /NCGR_PEP_ID=MMETSP0484_2-20121128/2574_1 /TAXON_ID=354590 /ORGANISM="Rhodomonas lens, Strain RHODO" /LENGTH=143 /DNA_ID=CAMNT_0019204597 /DNA_START=106 /DNA_END=537 /DNA_ORIENTATION=+